MSINRSLFTPLLGIAALALLGNAVFAAPTEQVVGARKIHPAAVQTTAPAALSSEYLSDRAALLQAALHLNDVTSAERVLTGEKLQMICTALPHADVNLL